MAAVQFGRPQLFILLLSIVSKIISEPIITTSCQDVWIEEGGSTSLTCTFTEEVDKLHKDFKVELYTNTQDAPTPVLLCHWSKEGYRDCYEYTGYKYGGSEGNNFTLNILSASLENNGQYACILLSYSKPGTYDKCTLTVEALKTSSTSTTTIQTGNTAEDNTAGQLKIIIGTLMTVIIILLIVIIVLFKCRPTDGGWLRVCAKLVLPVSPPSASPPALHLRRTARPWGSPRSRPRLRTS